MKALLRPGLTAVVQNWRPFVAIQLAAAMLAAAYYLIPSFQIWTEALARLKVRGGTPFAAVTTAVAGGLLPQFARWLSGDSGKRVRAADLLFQCGFFAIAGATIDLLYRSLGTWIGTSVSPGLVAAKVALDQFIFSPLVSIPFSVTAFLWYEHGFRWPALRAAFASGEYRRRYAATLVACWAFWIPVLGAVYAMPANLQFLLFLCTQAAWSLLLVHLNHRTAVQAVVP